MTAIPVRNGSFVLLRRRQPHLVSAVLLLILLPWQSLLAQPGARDGFVDLVEAVPRIRVAPRYSGSDNFVGRPIDGYEAPRLVATREAAAALLAVQESLTPFGLGLKLFDAYRPQRAVDHFVRWAQDLDDQRMKRRYYPNVDKAALFRDGYIAARSGHSRGSTVDLTLVDLDSGEELDMGSAWDFFDPASAPDSATVNAQQRANRLLLRRVMLANGFVPYAAEWWHFTLAEEPWPETYFDFPIQ